MKEIFIDIIIKIYLGGGHVSIENDGSSQVRASTRFCRHMGPDEKSDVCGICKLVCFILIFLNMFIFINEWYLASNYFFN